MYRPIVLFTLSREHFSRRKKKVKLEAKKLREAKFPSLSSHPQRIGF